MNSLTLTQYETDVLFEIVVNEIKRYARGDRNVNMKAMSEIYSKLLPIATIKEEVQWSSHE